MRTLKLEQPQGLVAVLAHRASEFGDRHDAAMNLGAFDEPWTMDFEHLHYFWLRHRKRPYAQDWPTLKYWY